MKIIPGVIYGGVHGIHESAGPEGQRPQLVTGRDLLVKIPVVEQVAQLAEHFPPELRQDLRLSSRDSELLETRDFFQGLLGLRRARHREQKANALNRILKVVGVNDRGSCANITKTAADVLSSARPASRIEYEESNVCSRYLPKLGKRISYIADPSSWALDTLIEDRLRFGQLTPEEEERVERMLEKQSRRFFADMGTDDTLNGTTARLSKMDNYLKALGNGTMAYISSGGADMPSHATLAVNIRDDVFHIDSYADATPRARPASQVYGAELVYPSLHVVPFKSKVHPWLLGD